MMADSESSSMKEAIARLERKHEEEKQSALEEQRREYERQFQEMQKQMMSPSANLESLSLIDSFHQKKSTKFCRLLSSEESFRQGLVRLREDIIRANGMVRSEHRHCITITCPIISSNLILCPGRPTCWQRR